MGRLDMSPVQDGARNSGRYSTTTGCSGVSGSVPRLGFPGICFADNGNSVRNTDGMNRYPSAIYLGASWNRSLIREKSEHLGAEFRGKGDNVALGPVAGPIVRVARGGRKWERFSNGKSDSTTFMKCCLPRLLIWIPTFLEHSCTKHLLACRNTLSLASSISSATSRRLPACLLSRSLRDH